MPIGRFMSCQLSLTDVVFPIILFDLKGKFGERGEQYVIAQFGLLLLIAIGSVPVV